MFRGLGFTFYLSPDPLLGYDRLNLNNAGHGRLAREFAVILRKLISVQLAAAKLPTHASEKVFPCLKKVAKAPARYAVLFLANPLTF